MKTKKNTVKKPANKKAVIKKDITLKKGDKVKVYIGGVKNEDLAHYGVV